MDNLIRTMEMPSPATFSTPGDGLDPEEGARPENLTALLAGIPFFKALSSGERVQFVSQQPPVLCFNENAFIIRQGERNRNLYLLLRGAVRITRNEMSQPLAVLNDGEFFGEMSFLKGASPRSNVVAARRTLLLRIDRPFLAQLPQGLREKLKDALMAMLIERLEGMNDSLVKIARFAQGRTLF